jgi:hypothetical protein
MDADLIATPDIENGQVVGWELCHNVPTKKDCGTGKTSSPYPKLEFDGGSGDHNIKINIIAGNGITFAQSNPLWIQPNVKPPGPIVAPITQIDPAKIKGAGTTELKFHDANSGDGMLLKYQLNFANGNGVMTIDPDIQNGGKGLFGFSQTEVLIAGGVLIAVILLLWRVRVNRRSNVARQSGTGTNSSGG